MKSLIMLELRKLLSNNFVFLLFGAIIFGLDERITGNLSSAQFVFNFITEHYYITYFMIPVFMLMIYKSLDDDMDYILIRCGSYWKYFKSKIIVYLLFSIVFVISQVIIFSIMSIGLEFDNSLNVPNNAAYELFRYYANYFNNSISAVTTSSLYMIIGLFIVSIVFFTINHFFDKKTSSIVIISLYILMNLGLKIPKLSNFPLLFIDNYIILHRSFSYDFKLVINLISMLLLLLITCMLNKYFWNRRFIDFTSLINSKFNNILRLNKSKLNNNGISVYYKKVLFTRNNVIVLIGIILLMCSWKLVKISFSDMPLHDYSLSYYLLNLFYGQPLGYLNPFVFLETLVLNLTPLYILSAFLVRESNDRNLFINIRLTKGVTWTYFILKSSILFIGLYTLLSILVPLLIGIIFGMSIDSHILNLLFTILITKFLDLIFEFLVIVIIYCLSKNIILSFFSLFIFNSFAAFEFKFMVYLPFGICGLSRINFINSDYGLSLLEITIELLILIILALNYVRKYSYKKILID